MNLPVYLAALPQLQPLLKGNDIAVSPGVWLDAHDLLLRLDREGRLPARFGDLRPLLAPLLCRNPEEQRRFKEIFRDWRKLVQTRQPGLLPGTESAEDSSRATSFGESGKTAESLKEYWPKKYWKPIAIALGALILAGLLWWGITLISEGPVETGTRTSQPEQPELPQREQPDTRITAPADAPDTDASKQKLQPLPPRTPRESPQLDPATHARLDTIGLLLPWLPVLLALFGLGGYGWRRRRGIARQKESQAAESLYAPVAAGAKPSGYLRLELPRKDLDLFGALPVQTTFRRLHRPVRYPTRRLAERATVLESVRRAGLFTPVYREHPRVPRIIVLVENRYGADPVTGLGALVVERLRTAGFTVHRYDYRGSPRAVWEIGKKPEESGGRHTLSDVAYRYPNSRVLLIGDPTTLLDPWGEHAKRWVSEFQIWPDRAILGARLDAGNGRGGWEKILGDAGFMVALLGSDGLIELGKNFSDGDRADTRKPATPLPEALRHPSARWLQPIPPDAREQSRLLRILRRFLGEDGFYLLAAIVVYPRLHWGLLRIMEYSLFPGTKNDPDPEPREREMRLLRLMQLPWFPRGWLPDWLRKALIHALDADRRARINRIYKDLIYHEAERERPPEGMEEIPLGPIVKPASRRRRAGAMAGVLLLAGSLGAGLWALWQETPWWEWSLRGETEELMLARQIDANREHSFAIVGNENNPLLARALRETLQTFGFSEKDGVTGDKRSEPLADERSESPALPATRTGAQHQILLGPDADSKAAKEIARRLAWLVWRQPGSIPRTVSASVPGDMIVARLGATLRPDPGVSVADEGAKALSLDEKRAFRSLARFRDPLKSGGDGPEMVVIPAGGFLMGLPESEKERDSDEGPQHWVDIPRPFALGVTEVTLGEFRAFVESTGYRTDSEQGEGCYGWTGSSFEQDKKYNWRNPGFEQDEKHPVACVNWNDATAYAEWLSRETGKKYRLPTESEWEYAARAGTTTPFSTGECIHTDQANYNGNYDYADCGTRTGVYRQKTVPAGSLPANPWGLHEMHGNVWEWTCSLYKNPYDGSEQRCTFKDINRFRVLRGGSWINIPRWLRSAGRNWNIPDGANNYVGFRLARAF
uniref:Formylglycine-generating enzyme, required for sulfatase activity, contains SUMF1/FGE domain n=1 Tax=Candidatus Kentrum sp. SD TaxID=2126332 RepID=A0A450YAW4_9GAMM|nr:MAG: Formylglycine-generating enzyme, required for sulfatase activity, contains SUMF1/FGE domain [Candidatus Kentron sp. SD]